MAATGTTTAALHRLPLTWLLLTILVFLVCMSFRDPDRYNIVVGEQIKSGDARTSERDTGICESVDIRNSVDQFERLKGCYVVEGFVRILLFDNVNETLLSNISFPELREITDYLLLYRVNGLRSIGQLFPNLSVIRGHKSFFGYAFVVFEMSSLQEIGLYSLTDIMQGLIRIDKNPSLCFVNSIDWNLIAHENGDHFIRSIKPDNECPICPGDDTNNQEPGSSVSPCHKAIYRTSSDGIPEGRHLCWNRKHCQKICPSNCSACNERGECCDSKCLGGCSGDKRDVCDVCRNFSMGNGLTKQCMSHCQKGFYEYMGRRCITREDCISLKAPLDVRGMTKNRHPYKIFNGSCIIRCPANYMDDFENHTCKPCEGRCKKECPGANIDSLLVAQQLRGCTHIKGSLEIQIRGGRNIVNELEENLNMIEEIDGFLKVVRSFPLVSLNFLKNLKVIHGYKLESQKYVFVVLDNQNLQDLWDWHNRTLRIENGKLFFHFNPRLCLYKIERLRQEANLANFTDLEVASNSNGDKIACNVTDLQVNVTVLTSQTVVLEWQAFKWEGDYRNLLGYVLSTIEAPHRNITLYDGRDACGGDGWRVDDVGIAENNGSVVYTLQNLKPYTQYAFYVKTYTIATERSGAQSRIHYFRTRPDTPSKPLNVQILSNTSDSLYVTWQPPMFPNGNVTHYIVSGQRHSSLNDELLDNRNYCHEPPVTPKQPVPSITETLIPPKARNNDTCSCDDDTKQTTTKIKKEKEILSQINFEDELHNAVYIKKRITNDVRKRRDVHNESIFSNDTETVASSSNSNSVQNSTEEGTDIWKSFSFTVYGKTEFYINKLYHFAFYDIYIEACRESEGPNDTDNSCSDYTVTNVRTRKKAGADNITNLHVKNQSLGMVTLAWDEPKSPNGMILTYQIEYKRLDIENSKPILECITRKYFRTQNMMYTLKLNPGNYSLRLMATSSATLESGNGEYTPYIYFYIEESTSSYSQQVVVFVTVFVTLVLLGTVAFYFIRRKRRKLAKGMKLITSVNPEYVSAVYEPDDWEVPRKKITLTEEIGQGSFGMVYEGIAYDIRGKSQIRCAVKTVNEHATNRERIEFLNEASVMKAFDTAHVVRLLGVVSQGQPTLVIMELMANGDLKSYLRSHRADAENYTGKQPPTLKRILQMAIEIADGMAYLAAKKFVHRDLAARNCMVAEDLTVKIGDFGMTRDIYETDYYRKGTKGLLPVRWMAPESLKDGVFTSSSDVWSYGVVLWEMATLASQPYQGLSNDQVLRYVIDGGVMERPENCPDKLYTLMRCCWQHKPSSRPTFLELVSHLVDDASETFSQISFYHSSAGMEARNANLTPSDNPSTPLWRVRELENFSIESSDEESEPSDLDIEPVDIHQNKLPVYSHSHPPTSKEGPAANGYVGDRATNGSATTQC